MTLKEAIQDAVRSNDAAKAGKIADWLRFESGFDYADTAALFKRCAGIELAEFEELMLESD